MNREQLIEKCQVIFEGYISNKKSRTDYIEEVLETIDQAGFYLVRKDGGASSYTAKPVLSKGDVL